MLSLWEVGVAGRGGSICVRELRSCPAAQPKKREKEARAHSKVSQPRPHHGPTATSNPNREAAAAGAAWGAGTGGRWAPPSLVSQPWWSQGPAPQGAPAGLCPGPRGALSPAPCSVGGTESTVSPTARRVLTMRNQRGRGGGPASDPVAWI